MPWLRRRSTNNSTRKGVQSVNSSPTSLNCVTEDSEHARWEATGIGLWRYYRTLGGKLGDDEWWFKKILQEHSQMLRDVWQEVATLFFGWSKSLLGQIGQVHWLFLLKQMHRSEIGQSLHLGAPHLQGKSEIPVLSRILRQFEVHFGGLPRTDLASFRTLEEENPGAWEKFAYSSLYNPQRAIVFPLNSSGFRAESPEEADRDHNLAGGMLIAAGFLRSKRDWMPFGFG